MPRSAARHDSNLKPRPPALTNSTSCLAKQRGMTLWLNTSRSRNNWPESNSHLSRLYSDRCDLKKKLQFGLLLCSHSLLKKDSTRFLNIDWFDWLIDWLIDSINLNETMHAFIYWNTSVNTFIFIFSKVPKTHLKPAKIQCWKFRRPTLAGWRFFFFFFPIGWTT